MNSYTLLSCIDSKVEHSTKFYGRFELGPFAPGQALTVANALRRSLLSQLSGSAVTLLEIKGASNEYEILNGVRESVLDIILNLKQVVLTSDFELFSPQIGFLNVKGPGIVRASDLKLPAFLYAVDPNQYIATLNAKGHLNMKYLICCGKNYITYTPNDEQYFEWLNLFEKVTPSTLNSQKIFKKAEESITKLNSNLVSTKTSLPFNLKKTLKLSFYNKNQENFFAKASAFSRREKARLKPSVPTKKTVPRQKPMDFYKQWIKERGFLKNHSVFINQLNQQNKNFPKYKKADLFPGYLEKSFENLLNKKAIISSKVKYNHFAESNGKEKINDFKKILEEPIRSASKVKNYKVGYFPIDAIFMPVNRVNYLIESEDDYKVAKDRIILEVWTNGSIHPRHAIHKAAKALIQLFLPLQQMRTTLFQKPGKYLTLDGDNILAKPSSAIQNDTGIKKKEKPTRPHLSNQDFATRILDLDIGNLELKAKPYSFLKKANINTIRDLISYSKKELLAIKNFELRSLVEVEKALNFLDLELK
uniref:DNA-directed RNA polymerase n=1 Tax=Hazenia capsulata TaxID=2202518 RepID=A0A1W6EHK3_9CHLO|nr:alpha subunit of RNA polymerase [Hazenia capsulata]ARK14871.1 alpha subunit of RNA polymerase [Hazenia capsulata]